MGRPGYACRDKWRMMKNNPKTGEWSEDEVKRLKVCVLLKCVLFLESKHIFYRTERIMFY